MHIFREFLFMAVSNHIVRVRPGKSCTEDQNEIDCASVHSVVVLFYSKT
jgi:hypothetical protein